MVGGGRRRTTHPSKRPPLTEAGGGPRPGPGHWRPAQVIKSAAAAQPTESRALSQPSHCQRWPASGKGNLNICNASGGKEGKNQPAPPKPRRNARRGLGFGK